MNFKKYIFGITLFVALASPAAFDDKIFIQGQIGNAFDKEKVKVIDSNDQTYFLPKSVFPKNFKFEKGKMFNVEVTLDQYKELDIKKSQK